MAHATVVYGLSTEMHSNKNIRLWTRRRGLIAPFYLIAIIVFQASFILTCLDLWSKQECCRWRCSLLFVGSPNNFSFDNWTTKRLDQFETIGRLRFITSVWTVVLEGRIMQKWVKAIFALFYLIATIVFQAFSFSDLQGPLVWARMLSMAVLPYTCWLA